MLTKALSSIFASLFIAAGLATSAPAAEVYTIDLSHSKIGFSVKHLGISMTSGQFGQAAAKITLDTANGDNSSLEAVIEAKSINTNDEKRDAHLRSADFFEVEKFPTITFKSTSVKANESLLTVTGDLTIKGVTKSITLPLALTGPIIHPFSGSKVIGLAGQTTINRQDFGVKWNKQMDQGGWIVGDEVLININIEAVEEAKM